MDFPRY